MESQPRSEPWQGLQALPQAASVFEKVRSGFGKATSLFLQAILCSVIATFVHGWS